MKGNHISHSDGPSYQYAVTAGPSYLFESSPMGLSLGPKEAPSEGESLGYTSSNVDSNSYTAPGGASSLTGLVPSYHPNFRDATDAVREMYLALLYLLSNPEEFQTTSQMYSAPVGLSLAQWNAEYETESITDAGGSMVTTDDAESTVISTGGPPPLPLVVFADDAEVVLPQAHTASQLFGLERIEGIELEAAAGIPSLSQLFLRWLALMPGGDHLNIIDPPGLTVMRIAGGRYRVTAAHRVVWTWMNEFAALAEAHGHDEVEQLEAGDLVTMTIVDVFETDSQGKLLSYCPTFDNRAVHKTNPATEKIRRSSSKLMTLLGKVQKSNAAKDIMSRAKNVASNVKCRMGEAAANFAGSPHSRQPKSNVESSVAEFEEALNAAETAATARFPASGSGSDCVSTLRDTVILKESYDKITRARDGHNTNSASRVVEQKQTQKKDSDAYFSDDEAAQEDSEI